MSALSIQPTYPIFTETDGLPLENGYIWIGTANLDPQINPINVYWDAALTQPAGQPIRTEGGYPVNSGTPARLYVNSDYSIRVMNKNGSVVYSAPAATERYSDVVVIGVNAEDVIYNPPFLGAVQTNVEAKLSQTVSVKDFGAVGDGVTDDTAAIQLAVSSGAGAVYFPSGTYKVDGRVLLPSNVRVFGDGAASVLKKTSTATQRNTFYFSSGSASNVEIDHLNFFSDRTMANADTAVIDGSINTTNYDNIYIHDNIFSYTNDGTGCILIAAKPTTTASNIRIVNNTFNGVKYFAVATNNNNSDAVIRNSHVHISGNVFKDCGSFGPQGFCVTIAGGTGNVVVQGNTFSGTNGYGVEFAGPVIGGIIDSNVFSGSYTQIIALSANAAYAQNDNIIISNNTTQGAVTANWTLQGCASLTMQGNRFNTSGELIFNGTTLGITAFVSGNWFANAISVINGADVTQFNNYIGTLAPVNTAPAQYAIDLSGGDTTSIATITFFSFTSWRPVGVWVRVVQVGGSGTGGAYAESVIAARILNGTPAVQISKTDTVTSAGLTLSVAYGVNTITITATSTTANVRQIWMIQPFGDRVANTTVAVSA